MLHSWPHPELVKIAEVAGSFFFSCHVFSEDKMVSPCSVHVLRIQVHHTLLSELLANSVVELTLYGSTCRLSEQRRLV